MSKLDVVRAWKDDQYRRSLEGPELGALPANPAGMIDLSEIELGAVAGGTDGVMYTGCVQPCTQGGCATYGQTDLESLSICAFLSALGLCIVFR